MKNKKLLGIIIAIVLALCAVFAPVYNKLTGEELPTDEISSALDEYSSKLYEEEISDENFSESEESNEPITEEAESEETETSAAVTTTKQTTAKQTTTKQTTTKQTTTKKSNSGIFSKDEVAAYIHKYGRLPDNFITKNEARALGWQGGSVQKYAPGKAIGGDYYSNYEETLPVKKGRKYYECDINTNGKNSRGAERIVFSNDGLIFYTNDHYETFTQLY